jgi:hypothetical protein
MVLGVGANYVVDLLPVFRLIQYAFIPSAYRRVLMANVQCEVAEAYQVCGRAEDARVQANLALEVLRPRENLGEADALVTLALLDSPAPEQFARALEILSTSKDLRWAQKARAFEAVAGRMEKAGLREQADVAVAHASACRVPSGQGIRAGEASLVS